jgi:hypothetical protein
VLTTCGAIGATCISRLSCTRIYTILVLSCTASSCNVIFFLLRLEKYAMMFFFYTILGLRLETYAMMFFF